MESINCLWIGNNLSIMEEMALKSHLNVGHECHLWTYENIGNVPNGVIVEDGNEILPASEIFVYETNEGKGSVSAFSNLFRYTVVYERGGWWCDTDVVCLKPFDFTEEYVLSTEVAERKKDYSQITSCVFKCPPKSDLMKYCIDVIWKKDRSKLEWGEIGPQLISEAAIMTGKSSYSLPVDVFCPVNWFDAQKIVIGDMSIPDSYAVHLWNEIWRRKSINKNEIYVPECLYERLKNAVLSIP